MKGIRVGMITVEDEFGLGSHVSHLTNEFSKNPEIDLQIIKLVRARETDEIGTEEESDGATTHYVNRSKNKIGIIRGISDVIKITRKILEIEPDILHINSGAPHLILVVILLKHKNLRARFPVVCTIHSLYSRDEKMLEWVSLSRYVYRKILSFLERKVLLKTLPNIIVVAPQMKELITDRTNAKIYTVPNGIDPEEFQDVPPKPIKRPAILYVGRLTKRKGLDVLLRAIPIVKKSIPSLSLYVIGTGAQENELKNITKELNIERGVFFLGFVSDKEKYSHYKSADICVIPSVDYDYAPIVLLEVMGCGRAIIASNVGGIPFMVENGKTGLLIEAGNVEELAEKITMLLQNEQLREKIGRAAKEKTRNFTWDKIAQQTLEVYKEIIKDHGLENGKKRRMGLL